MRLGFVPVLAAGALAAMGASSAGALEPQPAARTLVVTGQGEAAAEPDMLTLNIGVETQGETAAAALKQNNAQMRATVDRLKKRGVADKDMQTANLSVHPRYDYNEGRGDPRIVGYTASNTLTVRLRDVDGAGALIDEAVKDGANSLGGVSFGFADEKPLLEKAREAAVADARARAETLAKAAGVKLGPILQIQDGHSYSAPPPMPYMQGRAVAMEMKDTVIAAGESRLSASVTLVYEIR